MSCRLTFPLIAMVRVLTPLALAAVASGACTQTSQFPLPDPDDPDAAEATLDALPEMDGHDLIGQEIGGRDLGDASVAPTDQADAGAPDDRGVDTSDSHGPDLETDPDADAEIQDPDAIVDTGDGADPGPAVVPERILFIGNSFTFGGPIPDIVDILANDAGWPDPEVEYSAFGGESLEGHRQRESTVALVDEGSWDVVVLQEMSTRPTDNLGDPEQFKTDATWFHDRIKRSSPGARIILYETWARRADHSFYPDSFADPAEMQAQLRFHYNDAADDWIPAHATETVDPAVVVAPVGDAWETHLGQPDPIDLHASDAWHASSAGQYLNALVIYATIYERSVRHVTSWTIDDAAAERLQLVADETTGQSVPGGPDGQPFPVGLRPGQTVRVDVGGAAPSDPSWNHLDDPTGGRIGSLVATDHELTRVGLGVTDDFGGLNSAGIGANALGWPAEATADSYYCGSFDSHAAGLAAPAQVTLGDLDPSARYNLRLFASRTGTDGGNGRLTRYTVNTELWQDLEVADNTSALASFDEVAPSAQGDIVIDVAVSPDGASRFCYLGVLELTRTP